MGMDRAGVTFASLMTLGPALAVTTARAAEDLGYTSFWTAETTGPEAFSLLAAAGAGAPAPHADGGGHGRGDAAGAAPRA
jgi:alkanesulfonate monooxygenase SsuD/methylene tetrahydromethanopterin reductase-like flavin-dependent oxidoreductase (luciferase family)